MNMKKFLASLIPSILSEVLVSEAIQKDREKAEANQATANSIREELLKGYHDDVEANRRLTMYIFSVLDPSGEIMKQQRFEREKHVQDLAITYLKHLKHQLSLAFEVMGVDKPNAKEKQGKKSDSAA
jgi:hypothetical protein